MAQASNQELTDRFIQFYRNYYRDEIGELAQQYPNEKRSLYIDYDDLYQFDADLAEDYRSQPDQLQEYAEEALRLYDLPADVKLGNAHVRLRNLPESVDIRGIRVHDNHIGKLVSVQGIVRKATDVRPKITDSAFECQRCGTMNYIPQQDGEFQEPHECQGCERQGPFRINFDQSEFIDAQKIRVQESPEGLRGGETPQSIDMNVEDDITGKVTPGDHVTAVGVLHIEQMSEGNERSSLFDLYMDGVAITVEDEEFEDMDIEQADIETIIELSNEDDIYDQMVGSVAPAIYGYEEEKLAMILQLFSGVTKNLPDGSRIRGDLHMLLIGDPGTGKCLKGDTKVTLADGSERRVQDIVESNLTEPKPVDDGVWDTAEMEVPSLQQDGTVANSSVTKVWKREAPDTMYRITTTTGREVTVTPSHPLFVHSDGRFKPVQAENLTEGGFIGVPRTLPTHGNDTLDGTYRKSKSPNAIELSLPSEWTPALARLLGYIVAEGYVEQREDSTGFVSITNDDTEVLDDVTEALDELGLNQTIREPHAGTSAKEVMCSAGEFVSFLKHTDERLLTNSATQRVPPAIFGTSDSIKRAFLQAYIEGEAHVSESQREINVASMSRELLENVRSLLLSLGISSQLEARKNNSYRLRISGNQFTRYVDHVGFVTERKQQAAEAHKTTAANTNLDVIPDIGDELKRIRTALGLTQSECNLPRTTYQHYERGRRNPSRESLRKVVSAFEAELETVANADSQIVADGGLDTLKHDIASLRQLATGDVDWEQIETITEIEPTGEWVYDLEVAETHNYVTNNILSHNSQMLSYIENIAPRSVYTSGKGSSSAGLTAAAVQDDFGDGQQWTLEAGALVLADKGIAAVDELDKMASDDRSAMHEALEQQSYHPTEEILLADGRRVEIGTVVDDAMDDRAEEVIDGVDCEILPTDELRIHSVDPETNEVTKQPVDRVSRHEAPDEFVRITVSNGRSITVTPEHPMFVDDDGEIGTVAAADLDTGTFVPGPRKLPNSEAAVPVDPEPQQGREQDIELPERLTGDLAEILGLLIAEGHSSAGSAHEIGFSNQNERLLGRMQTLMRRVFGFESTDTTNAAGTVTQRWISTKLYRWFDQNFSGVMHTARDKRIPDRVLAASEEHIRRFLVGAFAGDGGVESEAMSFSTASAGLAEDYADALLKLGVCSRIHWDRAEDAWKVYVMGDSTEAFVTAVVDPADERYDDAMAFVERSNETPRHHDVLPTSAARELRELKQLLGVRLTGQFKPHLEESYGVQIRTVREQLVDLRERIDSVETNLDAAADLGAVRAAVGGSGRQLAGSGRQLADRLESEPTKSIYYAESGGYDKDRRRQMTEDAVAAVESALAEARRRIDTLESRCELRYYRVTDVEMIENEDVDWVYDVTVEPTNTFVSKGLMLHNSISISKAGINATLKSRCSLLGAANPKYGRFDQYEPIGEQIDLEPALISRFDLIFTVTDTADPEHDGKLADHILKTNYAGELNTQRDRIATSEFTQQQVDDVTEEVAPEIDAELLRKYVAHAKRSCFPTMTDEAKAAIREFYVDLRSKGADEDAPIPVTARKLEALVRLAEASARVRLSDTVEAEDADRSVDIVRSCLQDIGVDPETGQFDADVVETGTSKTQRDRIKNIKGLISDIEKEFEEGAPIEEVLDRADEIGMDADKAEREIEKLRRKGEVYEPKQDHLRTT